MALSPELQADLEAVEWDRPLDNVEIHVRTGAIKAQAADRDLERICSTLIKVGHRLRRLSDRFSALEERVLNGKATGRAEAKKPGRSKSGGR